MYKKNISVFVLIVILFCTNYDNPFLDPSNSQILLVKESTSFDTSINRTVLIFSTETLTVTTTVPEQLSWFCIKVTDNRLKNFDTVYNPRAEDYSCFFSFFDTGEQHIDIYAMRKNGDLINQRYTLYARSPLNQADLGTHDFEDTIQLYTDSVRDPVVYNWQFGSGGAIISSPSNKLKAVIPFVNSFQNKGTLYISDKNYTSPFDSFSYSFYDSTPPLIICMNSLYDEETNTVTTGDSVFYFKVRATDRDDNPVKVLLFDNDTVSPISKNIFTRVYRNMPNHTASNPLTVRVKAIDNFEFNNTSTKIFSLVYNANAKENGSTILYIDNILSDSVTSSRNNYILFGTVFNSSDYPVTVKSEINGKTLGDTTFINGTGAWSWNLTLTPGRNTFKIFATDTNGINLNNDSLLIVYQQDAPDTIPPRILSFTANGSDKAGIIYTNKDSVEIFIRAFDNESGIQAVIINNDTLKDSINQYEWTKKYHWTNHLIPATYNLTIVDNKKNFSQKSLRVGYNHVPYIKHKPSLPYLLVAGNEYHDTLIALDEDHDKVYYNIIHLPPNMTISQGGIIYFKPDIQNTGLDSICIQLTDSIEFSESYVWTYRITDPETEKAKVRFSSKQQFPSFIEAGDSLKINLLVDSSTGNPPFLYTVKINPSNYILLDSDTISSFLWKPQIRDTGEQIIYCIVEDTTYKQSDTLSKPILVVRPNSDPCSLYLPVGIHDKEPLYLNSKIDSFRLDFRINDDDHPLTESHTVTITYHTTTIFQPESLAFSVTIRPSTNLTDTLFISVNDKTVGSPGYKISIPIIHTEDTLSPLFFLSDINDLVIWNPVSNFSTINGLLSWMAAFGTTVSFNATDPPTQPTIVPRGINGYGTLSFSKAQVLYSSNHQAFTIDSQFTIFAVVKYLAENPYDHRVILSSATALEYIGFGFDKYGHPEIINKTQTNLFTSKIIAAADPDKWVIVSYRSDGIKDGKLQVRAGINTIYENVSLDNTQSGTQLLLGAGSRSFNVTGGWKGEIAEVAVYKRNITDTEANGIVRYFYSKFNLGN